MDQQEWWLTVQLCRRSLLRWRSPWRRRWTTSFIFVPALLEHNVLHALKQWLVQENKFAAPELQLTSFRDEEVGFFLHFINGQALISRLNYRWEEKWKVGMSSLRWKWPALTRYNFKSCQLLPFTIARLGLPVWPCLFRWGRVCRPTWPTQSPPRPTWPTSRRRIQLSTGDFLTSWAWGTSWRRNICKMEESSLPLRTSKSSGALKNFKIQIFFWHNHCFWKPWSSKS